MVEKRVARAYVGAMNAPAQPMPDRAPRARKPDWIRVKAPTSPGYAETRRLMRDLGLNTRSEEHTSELQSLMRQSYAVFFLKKKKKSKKTTTIHKYQKNTKHLAEESKKYI